MRNEKSNAKKSNQKQMVIIVLLVLVLITTVSVTVYKVLNNKQKIVLAPDYAPQETEKYAEKITEDDVDDKLSQQEGGGAVSLTYSSDVEIDLSEKKAKIMFANPSKSNQDMLIQIVIQDTVILQSGLIKPGYQVEELKLFDDINLLSGMYDGKFVVYYYQNDTREKAMINTEIPLTINVKE